MALIKYGGGIVQMSGSVAGSTHARNRFGNYMRARTKPVNPKSERQSAARNTIKYLAEYWHGTLNSTQRGAWDNYADGVSWNNALGETVKLTGFNHFIRSNAARLCAGLAIVADGPTSIGLPAIDPGFHFATSSYYQVLVTSYQPGAAWANETGAGMIVHAGRPQLATRNFFGGPWRYAGCVVGEASSPPAQQQNIAAPFTLTDDQIIWGFHQISMADGRLSTPSRYGPETIIESGP